MLVMQEVSGLRPGETITIERDGTVSIWQTHPETGAPSFVGSIRLSNYGLAQLVNHTLNVLVRQPTGPVGLYELRDTGVSEPIGLVWFGHGGRAGIGPTAEALTAIQRADDALNLLREVAAPLLCPQGHPAHTAHEGTACWYGHPVVTDSPRADRVELISLLAHDATAASRALHALRGHGFQREAAELAADLGEHIAQCADRMTAWSGAAPAIGETVGMAVGGAVDRRSQIDAHESAWSEPGDAERTAIVEEDTREAAQLAGERIEDATPDATPDDPESAAYVAGVAPAGPA